MVTISWELLHKLEREYGDSFYLLDIGAFQDNYHEFLESFRAIYPKTNIAYSYKTNYTPKLCQCVSEMGGYAEVVSAMEFDLAVRIGVHPQRIVFNGPYKCEVDLEKALLAGSIVNLDSSYEVAFVEEIAQRAPDCTMTVGLRCNFDIGTGQVSRFGFDIEGEELQSVFKRLGRLENCRVEGLHCHFTTRERSVESYTQRTRRMLEICAFLFGSDYPRFIDLGGGFFGKMSTDLKGQFPIPVPTYQEYATAIATQVVKTFPDGSGPELILEPGIAITGDVMRFVVKIVDIKTVRSRMIALASGSIHNIKPTLHEKNLPMQVFSNSTGRGSRQTYGVVDIVGYTCLEHDCLYKGYKGPLAVGDYVVFANVGAYITVMTPPFIRPSPPIIAHDPRLTEFEVVKRRGRCSDVFSTYVF